MILTNKHKQLLLKFCSGKISKDEIIGEYPDDLSDGTYLKNLYLKIIEFQSGDDLEYAMMLEPLFFNTVALREECYVQLAYATWHRSHEPLALVFLERIESDNCVDAIHHIAITNHEHLCDDDVENLAVQCTYALSNIETPRAIKKLQLLSQSANERIKSEALQRLDEIGEIQ